MKVTLRVLVFTALLLIVGCTVGPDYKRPDFPLPPAFREQAGPSDPMSVADLPWWDVFHDATLQALVNEAIANNYDLKIAIARIEQARQLVGVARSEALPQIGYKAFGGAEQNVAPSPNGVSGLHDVTYGGGLTAAWEMDVWGRIRRSTEAAHANLLAQEDVRRGVILTLVSDVATDYFQLLELDRELGIARESSRTYKRTLSLFSDRFHAGKDSELPVQRAQAAYKSSLAEQASLQRQIGQQENAISILLGGYPGSVARGTPLTKQVMPQTPLGATTDVLKRRPDILQAEQQMISANAEIGVAVANFYPRIGLSALAGGQGMLVDGDQEGFGIGNAFANIVGPLFTGGRLQSVYRERKAFWDETVAQYKKTVMTAFKETSDAMIAQKNLVHQRAGLQGQVTALRRSVDLSLLRYDAGRSSYIEVLEAQQQLFPAETALAQTQRDQLIAVIDLYKALGGGWQAIESKEEGGHEKHPG